MFLAIIIITYLLIIIIFNKHGRQSHFGLLTTKVNGGESK
jgi:hypothetical protein